MSSRLLSSLLAKADPSQVAGLSRFFKCGPGEYGQGDKFLGIKVPITRAIVRKYWNEVRFEELEEWLASPYHEIRLAALLTLVELYSNWRREPEFQKECVDFYLAHTKHINNWDLVDLSCYRLLGEYLRDKERSILYDLARDGKTIWERRIGIVSTMAFVRNGDLHDTYAIAQIFLDDPHPLHQLLQKAVGWLLREAGKRDMARLAAWLTLRAASMPRTMLRYAIEKFPDEHRRWFMELKMNEQ